ncbi:MAG: YdeI/OmpD-associated family protein [Spirochaetaceae bacterium]|nr:YdeI/OmpD-associated family protein [Spirochaetaceae bacterium]
MADSIRSCVREAIAIEQAGLTIDKGPDLEYPEELIDTFDRDSDFKAAFECLTPGRQRGYILHYAAAKQSTTRAARIARSRGRIFDGKGIHDR